MDQAAPEGNVRRSRFWLYTPFVLLLLLAVAWSVAWFVIRSRTAEALDGWVAAEARAGREWTCGNRTIVGYPFRIEIVCDTLDLKRGAVTAAFGRTEAVAQVYQPRRVILEVAGPLRVTDGTVSRVRLFMTSWTVRWTVAMNSIPASDSARNWRASASSSIVSRRSGEVLSAGSIVAGGSVELPVVSVEQCLDALQAATPAADLQVSSPIRLESCQPVSYGCNSCCNNGISGNLFIREDCSRGCAMGCGSEPCH